MYCKHCGKELSDEAFLCPSCGAPTREKQEKAGADEKRSHLTISTIALFLAIFSFVTGIIFCSFFYVFAASAILLYMIGATTILPALVSVCLGIAVLIGSKVQKERMLAIIAIALAGTALLFLFLSACIIGSGTH